MRSSLGSFVSAQSNERPNSTTLLPHGETWDVGRPRPAPAQPTPDHAGKCPASQP
ncbi:hypothetical protein GQF42_24085 [Streptomyces broussonetiae]|uniref:Uncharacterized protein n=1 Tax=Streptomyces broussonetiae TaxID=2686304 RepID=A0A6I6MYN9_9ACTN|nr:hypothetical protein GQF42_24085 [Streptomyces broussonetiae]